ncbi:hypothetical protein HLB23_26030 [Nocardia uniformis]|uniref:DUF2126 domain-containing protein n=2 Tax=Nocardia uniformis TaxID=53432 RepID=A0A849C3H3_9NOCA|nr:hypothetical protein [Nocardia uniformis]
MPGTDGVASTWDQVSADGISGTDDPAATGGLAGTDDQVSAGERASTDGMPGADGPAGAGGVASTGNQVGAGGLAGTDDQVSAGERASADGMPGADGPAGGGGVASAGGVASTGDQVGAGGLAGTDDQVSAGEQASTDGMPGNYGRAGSDGVVGAGGRATADDQVSAEGRASADELWGASDIGAEADAGAIRAARRDDLASQLPEWRAEPESARAVIAHIASGLGLPPTQVRPAYEDPLLRLASKARAPEGEPIEADADLMPEADSVQARKEMLARLDTAVTEAAAYVLPLHRRPDEAGWASADWRLRRGRIVLTEGDSPAGLRLPLGSISWQAAPAQPEADPIVVRPHTALESVPWEETAVVPADRAPTTALVAEVRDGRLFVFLPPVAEFDAYLDLMRRVEAAVAAVGQPVVLEGYPPPVDPRLCTLSITPDPGVIEVNVQPTETFAEQSQLLETLYEQARLARLSTESFDIDGTHSGTGGGNHITLGGRTPARSPLLRRPDLLVSMLSYWQRHPALSYLFSGRFIGPTSQAPRADEGRVDALYELEIAFAEIARLAQRKNAAGEVNSAPWEVDRALRHLLTDLTGNTHRAEFCIDKLYSPDSARGRLGLVELRGFEMPPHFRMAMVQALLVRALVLRFWERPFTAPLIRHGANLHGRYLLPHYVLADIAEVAADLRAHGVDFETSWLDPFTEFRFPRIGTVVLGDMELELRGAIEPWNTLGEQTTAHGTARYVDSSVERLQVRLVGADRGRYGVTCNGFPVPLVAAGKDDVQVAGVRYRAWQPPNALHPSITVDAPLTFDVVDLEAGLSRGGCTYYVSHPGGRSYDVPPVNAIEAQSRRNRRFEPSGHTSGPVDMADLRAKMAVQATDIGAPGILDLRRARTVWGVVGDR